MPYQPEVVTIWLLSAPDESSLAQVFETKYDDEGDSLPSPFQQAYRLGWYDSDFAEIHFGEPTPTLLTKATEYCRTLDEQTLNRLPIGNWNGLYLIFSAAGKEWTHPDQRPPIPHGTLEVAGVTCKLLDTFYIIRKT